MITCHSLHRRSLLLATLVLFLATGCPSTEEEHLDHDVGLDASNDVDGDHDGDGDGDLEPTSALDLPNALGAGGHDLLPWPADQYMEEGRIKPDPGLLPAAFTPTLLEASGASRITPIVAYLPGSFDPASLPDPDEWGATLEDQSSIRVVVLQDEADPVLWPVLAEIDSTASDAGEATLLLRPHRPFPAGSRVAVGLRTSLRTAACADDETSPECVNHQTLPALTRILDGAPEGPAERAWLGAPRDALLRSLELLGPDVEDLAMAWTFTVRFNEEITNPMLAMQEIAAQADPSNYTLQEVEYRDNRAQIYGQVEVPWFLDENDRLVVDDDGRPQIQETRNAPFMITIPRSVNETRPVVLFGHGFFSAIEEPTWGNLFNGLDQWQMSAVTTRFFGFAEVDLTKALAALAGDTLDGMIGIIDLQRQSQANFTVVHNLISQHLATKVEVDFGDGPFRPLDAEQIPYMGISNGGTQGLVMMSTSPVLTRGALVVPGGGWSHMLQRAAQWKSLGLVFSRRYDSDAELQLAMSLLQLVFDPVDSLNFVEHLIHDRFPGLPAEPDVLLVEARNDSQVANLVTRWVAGTAQIPLITPAVDPVWNLPTEELSQGDALSTSYGYEIYDLGVADNPPGNIAADENGVHDQVRLLPEYRQQMGLFLEEGRIERTCDGPCLIPWE